MFSSTREEFIYDFESDENAGKWKGLLTSALEKVQYQVHPSLSAKEEALQYVESLIFRLLSMLCAAQPHTVQDVEERVQKTFPHPIDKWAIGDAQNAIEKGKKKSSLVLPVDKIHPLLQKDVLGYKIDLQVTQYIVAVLEYISADILKLAGNYVKNIRHLEITCQDIKVAMCADKVLMDMFYQDEDVSLSLEEEPVTRTSLTYDEVIKDIIHEEKQYLRDLNLIIKLFREPLLSNIPKKKEFDSMVFSNIMEIYDFTVTLLGSFEDALEMADENRDAVIGACFEEMAENEEFDVYERYAEDILVNGSREKLMSLLQCPEVSNALAGLILSVKYVLPKLLLGPIYHCFQYFEYLKVLKKLSPSEEDRESLEQAQGLLQPLKADLDRICSLPKSRRPGDSFFFCSHGQTSRQVAVQKMNELQKSIDGWEGKDIGQCCSELITDGVLGRVGFGSRRLTERHVFLFDGLVILCKPNSSKRSSVTGSSAEFRLKERYYLRKIEVSDREDTEDLKNQFVIAPRDQPPIILYAKTPEEKCNWMASLIMLTTRSIMERNLDCILSQEQKKHPLRLPSPTRYRFAVEDGESNIIFEENKSLPGGVPLIKGATLLKLVERLTYHMYADPMFVRTFLTTYRSFCQPQELLDLLIERFEIPEPSSLSMPEGHLDGMELENLKNSIREESKRFRKEYQQPVQFRVLNVLRHWVDHHYYDFERDQQLLQNLKQFLLKVRGKNMKKWVESINKVIQRRSESLEEPREITFSYEKTLPTVEWYLSNTPDKFELMTLHPIEIARQLTLLEFDLFRRVKPSELVGSVWTKKDKHKTSPNLLNMMHHSSKFSYWLMRSIVETENFEERVAVVSRVVEIMIVLQELNNFTGVLEVAGAMSSACVHRLEHTLNAIKCSLKKALDDASELNSDHFKKYQEKLRSINPPCVPFFGMYLTNILHIEEGNTDFLPNFDGLINFSKRRKVAEITGEIQQYQNQPYCLMAEPSIRQFLENLDPIENRTDKELNDYLYSKSLEIEPRGCKQLAKFPRRWPEMPLKSPGIKPRLSGRGHHPVSLPNNTNSNFSISSQHLNQDGGGGDDDSSPRGLTPTTPLSPMTPPAHSASALNSDNSVFAPVLIGTNLTGAAGPSNLIPLSPAPNPTGVMNFVLPPPLPPTVVSSNSISPINISSSAVQPAPLPPLLLPPLPPPPLPPRRKREPSLGDTSPKVKQAPDAPLLPPRETSPPPLPPRRDIISTGLANHNHTNNSNHHGGGGTLPRMHSTSHLQSLHHPAFRAGVDVTLPRRNSALEMDVTLATSPRRLSQSSMNGPPTPHIPPMLPPPYPGPPPVAPPRPPSLVSFNASISEVTSGGSASASSSSNPLPSATPQLPPKTYRQTLLMNNHAAR